ncbi:MAG: transporter [Frankiales bacterium]|nr:transporter [Frankiales bacterium]
MSERVMVLPRITFSDVLRVREFRWLWGAELQSVLGDQLARVALTVLVFGRTGSATLTAGTYALTFLPALAGGALLSGLADRCSKRAVMVGCDLARALLLTAMALPGLSLAAVSALLVFAVLAGSPFTAAQSALLPQVLDGDRYVVAMGLRNISGQLAQLAGFTAGGLAVITVGPHTALLLDALTFALSAALIRIGLRPHRPVSRPSTHAVNGDGEASVAGVAGVAWIDGLTSSVRYLAGHRDQRARLRLAWIYGLFVVPEGLAAPLARQLHGGSELIGLLLAAGPAGAGLGAFLLVRLVPAALRDRLPGPLCVAAGLPLLVLVVMSGTASAPTLPTMIALAALFLSGLCTGYLVILTAAFTRRVPAERRGQIVGLASSGLLVSQGLGLLLGGLLAGQWTASTAIALAGLAGIVLAITPAARLRPPSGGVC